MFILLSIIIAVAISLILLWLCNNKSESFWRIFPPFSDYVDSKRIFNIPLTPLTLPVRNYNQSEIQVPSFFAYDPKMLVSVRNQENTPFCWGFAIAALLSDYTSTRISQFKKWVSIQDIVSCFPHPDPNTGGAVPEEVLIWLSTSHFSIKVNNNIDQFPRQLCSKTTSKNTNNTIDVNTPIVALTTFQGGGDRHFDPAIIAQNVYNIKRYLTEVGPVLATIDIYDDLENFSGNGIYRRKSDNFQGGHVVEIVGWCDAKVDPRPQYSNAYWICRNSWGSEWASRYDFPGYFAIAQGQNMLGIESRVTGATTTIISVSAPFIENLILLHPVGGTHS